MDGGALPAGELARCAALSPQATSAHLNKLVAGGFLLMVSTGRHCYYRLASTKAAYCASLTRGRQNCGVFSKFLCDEQNPGGDYENPAQGPEPVNIGQHLRLTQHLLLDNRHLQGRRSCRRHAEKGV